MPDADTPTFTKTPQWQAMNVLLEQLQHWVVAVQRDDHGWSAAVLAAILVAQLFDRDPEFIHGVFSATRLLFATKDHPESDHCGDVLAAMYRAAEEAREAAPA